MAGPWIPALAEPVIIPRGPVGLSGDDSICSGAISIHPSDVGELARHAFELAGERRLAGERARGAIQPFARSNRPFSRAQSRFFSVSRLSCSFLPLASASSTL